MFQKRGRKKKVSSIENKVALSVTTLSALIDSNNNSRSKNSRRIWVHAFLSIVSVHEGNALFPSLLRSAQSKKKKKGQP